MTAIAWHQTEFASLEVEQEDIFGFWIIFKSPPKKQSKPTVFRTEMYERISAHKSRIFEIRTSIQKPNILF